MRMVRKHRTIAFLLTVVLLLSQCIVCAESFSTSENKQLPSRYQAIAQISASLKITGNTAKCISFVALKSGYSGTLTVTLQRRNGNSWLYVNSWTENVPTGGVKSIIKTQSLSIHGTYRVKVSFASSVENETLYSHTAVY